MDNPPPLDEREQENLSAYLDGELGRQEARAVEAKLSGNAEVRGEAETLRRTWELLDFLPRPEPSPDFTSRTLERLTVAPSRTSSAVVAKDRGRWLRRAGWAAAVLMAAAAGYAGTTAALRPAAVDPDEQLVRDLHLIQNVRGYEAAGDVDFLRKLADADDPELFGEGGPGS